MYMIVWKKRLSSESQTILKKDLASLDDAKEARELSGDLVATSDGKIVTDPAWLWEWEKEDPTSYATRAIRFQQRQPKTR